MNLAVNSRLLYRLSYSGAAGIDSTEPGQQPSPAVVTVRKLDG